MSNEELTPEQVDEYQADVFEFLNELRDSGVTNMFGASPYLVDEFDFPANVAKAWLIKWMKSFGADEVIGIL